MGEDGAGGMGECVTTNSELSPQLTRSQLTHLSPLAPPPPRTHPSTPRDIWVYSTREERQAWSVAGLGAGGDDGGGDGGGSLWLPGGCVVTFRMVPGSTPAAAATVTTTSSSNGSSSNGAASSIGAARGGRVGAHARDALAGQPAPPPRGVVMAFTWVYGEEGSALAVEREYDGAGRLVEVRATSSVKGAWSGGRM